MQEVNYEMRRDGNVAGMVDDESMRAEQSDRD